MKKEDVKPRVNELVRQRALFLMERDRLLEDPMLILADRVKVLSWVISAAAVAQIGLRLI